MSYVADRALHDPAETLRFVDGVAASFQLTDPFLLEYGFWPTPSTTTAPARISLAAAAPADDLEYADRPETVLAFKKELVRVARVRDARRARA